MFCHQRLSIANTEGYRKQVFCARARVRVYVYVKMLQEYWAGTVIFIEIFSQCREII